MESSLLQKTLSVLEYLASREETVRLGALAEELTLTKSSAHHIANELVRLGYVERLEQGHSCLTARLNRIAAGASQRS